MKTLVHAEEILLEYFMRSIVKFLGKKPQLVPKDTERKTVIVVSQMVTPRISLDNI